MIEYRTGRASTPGRARSIPPKAVFWFSGCFYSLSSWASSHFFRAIPPSHGRLSFFRKLVQYRESKSGHVTPHALIPKLTLPIEQTSPAVSVIRAGTIQRTGLFGNSREVRESTRRSATGIPNPVRPKEKRPQAFKAVQKCEALRRGARVKDQATALHKRCGEHCHAPWSSARGRC